MLAAVLLAASSTGAATGVPLFRTAIAILLTVSALMAMHVAVGGEGLSADLA